MNDTVISDKKSLKKAKTDSSVKSVSFTIERVKKHPDTNKDFLVRLRVFIVSMSAILSVIALSNIDLLNKDGFLYLETAEIFLSDGFSAAFTNYNWPFFSIISALVSRFSGLSVEYSFYTLSIIFFSIMAYAYIRICEINFSEKGLIFAAIIFVCASTINSYRDQIIRDHGYWAFTLLGIYYLTYSISKNSLKQLLFSFFAISLSIFFRVEGIINLILFPLIYLFLSETARKTIKSNKLVLCLIVIAVFVFFVSILFFVDANWKLLSDVKYYVNADDYINKLLFAASVIKDQILPSYSKDYAIPFVLTGVTSILLIKIMSSIGLAYLVSVFFRYKYFFSWLKSNKSVFLILLALLLPLVTFVFKSYFLSTRYTVILSIVLLFPISYVFYHVLYKDTNKIVKCLFSFLLLYSFVDGLISFNHTDKSYYIEASEWIELNTQRIEKVITNDQRINYLINKVYSTMPIFYLEIIYSTDADVLVLTIDKKDKKTEMNILSSLIWEKNIEFMNNKKDRIIIYKRSS